MITFGAADSARGWLGVRLTLLAAVCCGLLLTLGGSRAAAQSGTTGSSSTGWQSGSGSQGTTTGSSTTGSTQTGTNGGLTPEEMEDFLEFVQDLMTEYNYQPHSRREWRNFLQVAFMWWMIEQDLDNQGTGSSATPTSTTPQK